MDDWEKLNEISLPEKERFLQSLKYLKIFGNFRNMCLEIYELGLEKFFQLYGYHGRQI